MEGLLYTAFIFGLLSSLHCIGMCGPIAMMLPVSRTSSSKRAFQIALYHAGRLLTYASLGLIFGFLGKGLFIAGIQQQISIAVGVLMIALAIIPERLLSNYGPTKPIYKLLSGVKNHLGAQFKRKSWDALFTIGAFNGLLPCGMVYAALFGAIAMQNPALGAFYMLLFGLGTIPLMTLVVYTSNFVTTNFRNKLQKLVPVFIVIMGSLFILRGMGLNIPFISPNTLNLTVQSPPDCVFP
jgi:uncharacterized protein